MARILCIEDDPDFQHLVGLTLRPHGYEMHYAFTGPEGYEKVLSLAPDIILLDLMLPGMNGVQIIKALQGNKSTKFIPIIVMTAYNDAANMLMHSIMALGAVEFIQKPVQMKELLIRIKSALAGQTQGSRGAPASDLHKGAVRADPKFRTVWIGGKLAATLPPKRFLLLRLLMEQDGAVTRGTLKDKIWRNRSSDSALEKAIQRLREDLGPLESQRIQTTAQGYELIG